MNTCGDGHDEIVYICRKCPMCEALEQIVELESKIDDLKKD